MRSDDDPVDALRRAHREASRMLDDAPAARVRAAVLAAAARGVDAPPSSAVPTATTTPPLQSRRWPLSAAALLLVSVMTGLVATHVLRDSPERHTTVAAVTSDRSTRNEALTSSDAPPKPASTPANDRTAAVEPQRSVARKPVPVRRASEPAAPTAPAAPPVASESREPQTVPAPTPGQSAFVAPPAAASPPALPVAGASMAKSVAPDSATATDARLARSATEGPRTSASKSAPTTAAITATRARIGRTIEPSSPAAWVERIVKLRDDGDDAEADRELDALRQRYPGFPIPATALKATGTR